MKHIVLVNMGAPESQTDMKLFLRRMFRDPSILPMNALARTLLGELISTFRYKKSWNKYKLIGGSPLKKCCNTIARCLGEKLDETYQVCVAYSYSDPLLRDLQLSDNDEVVIIPMYPQASFSTTGSIERDVAEIRKKYPQIPISIIPQYFERPVFINFWAQQINHAKQHLVNPVLLFSAHSVPQYQIDKGDSYEKAIHYSAKQIADAVRLPFRVGFQSKIGRMKWLSPTTISVLDEMLAEGITEILIVPISFVTENLETLYDIDHELIPYVQRQKGLEVNIQRVSLFDTERDLASLYSTFVL